MFYDWLESRLYRKRVQAGWQSVQQAQERCWCCVQDAPYQWRRQPLTHLHAVCSNLPLVIGNASCNAGASWGHAQDIKEDLG